ncbi:hypothetical protein CYCD_04160 [Tenuifilaceae bacterium CYCD]|nr:hypothetical protein CYCD_04160 [Tenuifilaceae bacterium CYCD]
MTNEEQLLAAMEEVSNQLNEIKKAINRPANNSNIDLSPIGERLDSMKENLQKLNYASISKDSEYKSISDSLRNLRDILSKKQSEVVHRFIEIKKPQKWIIAVVLYFLVSTSICLFVIYRNVKLKETINILQPNDFKYRYLKLSSFDIEYLRKRIENTTDLVYSIDDYYSSNKKDLEAFVVKREEEIRRMNEANVIARQKELEAKKAKEELQKLKDKYNKN